MDRIIPFLTRWLSQSGDSTFWSWVITFFYIITTTLSIYYLKKIKPLKPDNLLWYSITVLLMTLGINKQLDIQILVAMTGHFFAKRLGLLDFRNSIEIITILGVSLFLCTVGIIILFRIRSILRKSVLELSGVFLLLMFVVIRVGSISLLKMTIIYIHGLELLGLVVILYSLLMRIKNLIQ